MAIKKIGRYQIIRELERGGMATVYLARDQFSGRQVAVKLLPPQFTHDPRLRIRFKREAKAIAALEHAYIVPVYDFGEDDGLPYIVMRYMSGGTLAEWINNHPMPLADALPILQRLGDALDTAHRRGIIHRDLKPRNVLFDDEGHAFLSDFGLAKLTDGVTTVSSMGMFGTPAYMSPEQASGDKAVDGRSDVYALGVVLYEMLCGHRPFIAETPLGLMLKHVNEPVPPLDTMRLGLPVGINQVLACALAKKPDDRYPTATALAEALAALIGAPAFSSGPMRRAPGAAPRPTLEAPRFNLWWASLVGVGLMLALLVGWFVGPRLWGVSPPTATALPPTATASSTASPTATPTPMPTATATATPTATATATPSATATLLDTPTATATFRAPRPTQTHTHTPVPLPTDTPLPPPPQATATDTPEPTPVPP